MSSEAEIGVWVEGVQKWVTGVSRRTTCHDVIKALLRSGGQRAEDSDVMQYMVVERWRKVERPLDHEQRILKVWRTWGEAVSEVRFSLRRVRDGEGCGGVGAAGTSGRAERSRRRHRLRHQHGSRESLQPAKKLSKDDPKFSETMERLMRLVVAQGETIQAQLRRLQERECQIEQYEHQMHLLRVQNLGRDYLLHSYLKDDQSDTKDDPGSEEKSNDSGVVTEEVNHALDAAEEEAAAAASELEELQLIVSQLARIEDLNTRLLHEEDAMAGMATAVQAAHDQHKDEAELLEHELACVAHAHAQLVADVRQNEQRLRETENMLWQQRKKLDMLLEEERESDQETRALKEHLDYIIHLPPTAFRLPADPPVPPPSTTAGHPASALPPCTTPGHPAGIPPPSTTPGHPAGALPPSTTPGHPAGVPPPSSSTLRVPQVNAAAKVPPPAPAKPNTYTNNNKNINKSSNVNNNSLSTNNNLKVSSTSTSIKITTLEADDSDTPPPLPSCPPPRLDDEEDDDGDSAKNSSLCVSSRSSTSSETSNNSFGLSKNTKTATPKAGLSTLSKASEAGKDTDSTDSNSDTGLSSLHSSSDEGVYVLDTLV